MVVLMASIMKPISKLNKTWKLEDYSRIKKCKPNILTSSNHHESSGFYASFGNKGSFDKIVSSYVGQYVSKKSQSFDKTIDY